MLIIFITFITVPTALKIALFLSKLTRQDRFDVWTKYSARKDASNDTQKDRGQMRVFGVVAKKLRYPPINFAYQAK